MTGIAAVPREIALAARARASGLVVCGEAHWPSSTVDSLPSLPGFIDSTFSPLVAEVSDRCLAQVYGHAPAPAARGERTAVVLSSGLGDITTANRVARAVAGGGRVGPLLFFASVPNAVAGHVAARWGLAGPVVSLSGSDAGLAAAALLFDDGDADEALVVHAEQSLVDGEPDRAEAVLVGTVRP